MHYSLQSFNSFDLRWLFACIKVLICIPGFTVFECWEICLYCFEKLEIILNFFCGKCLLLSQIWVPIFFTFTHKIIFLNWMNWTLWNFLPLRYSSNSNIWSFPKSCSKIQWNFGEHGHSSWSQGQRFSFEECFYFSQLKSKCPLSLSFIYVFTYFRYIKKNFKINITIN